MLRTWFRFRPNHDHQKITYAMLRTWFGTSAPKHLKDNSRVDSYCYTLHLWNMITDHPAKVSDFRACLIQHPALRIIHRVLACTMFARSETNKVMVSTPLEIIEVITPELAVINKMLQPDKFQDVSLTMLIVKHWFELSYNTFCAGAITMGMYVTFIAQKLGLDLEPTSTQASFPRNNILDHTTFCSYGFIEVTRGMAGQRDTYKWKLEGMPPIDLPYDRLDCGNPNTWLVAPRCEPTAAEPDLAGHEEAGEEKTMQHKHIPEPMQTDKSSLQPPPQLPHQLQVGQYYQMPPATWYTNMHSTITSMRDMIQEIWQTSMDNSAQLDECSRRIGNIEKQLRNHRH